MNLPPGVCVKLPMMHRRLVITAVTAGLALVAFLLTFLFDPPEGRDDTRGTIDARPVTDAPLPNTDKTTLFISPGHAPDQVTGRDYYVRSIDREGRIIEALGRTHKALPGNEHDIGGPDIRVHMQPKRRVVQITAIRSRFVAPDNAPRSGMLDGNVVIALYESPEGQDVIVDRMRSPHIRLLVFLEQAHFDLTLNRITSDGKVQVTSQVADFRGTGLDLVLNERAGRIDRLEIKQGDQLRFASNMDALGSRETPTREERRTQRQARRRDKRSSLVYYRGRFLEQVHVTSNRINMTGSELHAVFHFDRDDESSLLINSMGVRDESSRDGTMPGLLSIAKACAKLTDELPGHPVLLRRGRSNSISASPLTSIIAMVYATALTDGYRENARSLLPRTDNDIVVHWAGPFVLTPEPDPDPRPQASDDLVLELIGRPLRVTTTDDQVIEAARLTYRTGSGKLSLIGKHEGNVVPITVDAPGAAKLRCGPDARLVIDQSAATGTVDGPGTLETRPMFQPADSLDALRASADQRDRDNDWSKGLRARWRKSLQFTFYQDEHAIDETDDANDHPGHASPVDTSQSGDEVQDGPRTGFASLRGLRSAQFDGDVRVNHPQLGLDAQQLAIAFARPAKEGEVEDRSTPTEIKAQHAVHVQAQGNAKHDPFDVYCDDLLVIMVPALGGRIEPDQLIAKGNVRLEQFDKTFEAGHVDIDLLTGEQRVKALADQSGDRDGTSNESPSRQLAINTITASDGVQGEMSDPAALVTAARVVADAATRQVTFYGDASAPARLIRHPAALSAHEIVMNEVTQTVRSNTAGTFIFRDHADTVRPKDKAPGESGGQRDEYVELVVRWAQSMYFDHRMGLVQARGDVQTTSQRGQDNTLMRADELQLELMPVPHETPALTSDNDEDPASTQWTVRKASAIGNVTFEAQQWENRDAGDLRARLQVKGPRVDIDAPAERVKVIGQGTMLVDDKRAAGEIRSVAGVQFANGGLTLFKWDDALTIDAFHNDILIEGKSQMLHRPVTGDDMQVADKYVQLDCRRLTADLSSTGGLSALTGNADATRDARINGVSADGDVRILHETQTITADRAIYNGADEIVTLEADGNNYVRVFDDNDVASKSAQRIVWELSTNTFRMTAPGPTIVPMTRKRVR